MKAVFSSLLKSKAWGLGRVPAAEPEAAGKRVQVFRRRLSDRIEDSGAPELVGELSLEEDEFVFSYVRGYTGAPISAFPDTEASYRAKFLWPFFEVRIPPTSREDVREIMEAEKIDGNDPFELLAKLGRLSVANSYELRLAGES